MDLDAVWIHERDVGRHGAVGRCRMPGHGRGLQMEQAGGEDRAPKVVGAPVGEAAAGVVDVRPPAVAAGAEVAVAAAGVVGLPRGGAEPEIPVDLGGRGDGRQVAGHRPRADGEVNRRDRAQFARPAGIDERAVVLQHPLAASGDHAAVAAGRLNHQRPFAEGEGLGLLEVDVLARPAGGDRHDRVPVVGRGDVHRVDVVAAEHLAEVDQGRAVGGAVLLVDAGLRLIPPLLPHIAHGDILHVGPGEKRLLVARAHVAQADSRHHDPVACRRRDGVAEGLRRDHVGHGDGRGRGGRGLEEATAAGRGVYRHRALLRERCG